MSAASKENPFGEPGPAVPMHVQRMQEETKQVIKRLQNLSGFIDNGNGSTFFQLPVLEQRLMVEQLDQMTAYAKTLSLRYCMALVAAG